MCLKRAAIIFQAQWRGRTARLEYRVMVEKVRQQRLREEEEVIRLKEEEQRRQKAEEEAALKRTKEEELAGRSVEETKDEEDREARGV